jgi:hypothetical protein
MLNDVLVFLKNHLNHQLNPRAGWTAGDSQEETVVFIDGERMDPIIFKLGAVTVLLINVEEENTLRPADAYLGLSSTGDKLKVNPAIRMNLYVLFVARFKQYEIGLEYLSDIIRHFQNHRVFDHTNAPELNEGIEKLILELVTLPFAEQNEVWNALRTTYHPSVIYKVKMIVFRDTDARHVSELTEKDLRTNS